MSAVVIPLNPDIYKPMSFTMSADQALAARCDYKVASVLLEYAQQTRMLAIRGEMTPERRVKLLEAYGAILDHPRLR